MANQRFYKPPKVRGYPVWFVLDDKDGERYEEIFEIKKKAMRQAGTLQGKRSRSPTWQSAAVT